ncbi:MAG: cytochrome C, partial [Nitrospirota bacterium]
MLKNAVRASLLISMLSIIAVVVLASDARAVPSFARQTGFSCFMCHTVYPELKPLGREFKLTGYVISRSVKPYEFPPPLAGLVLASFTHLDGRLPSGYLDSEWSNRILSGGNDVLSIPQEANLYYAGRIYGGVGGFVQGTYEGDSNSFHLDMTDVRFARTASIGGSNLVYGITVNNSPTVQDLWNTTPAWGYPFESSDVAPRPAAGAVIDGALDQQVGGIGLYVLWNRFIYAEFTAYHTTESGIASPLGAGTETDMVVEDIAPYWRVALQHQWGEHYVSVGTYGIAARIFPEA